jgi:rod shape determining protein RodA
MMTYNFKKLVSKLFGEYKVGENEYSSGIDWIMFLSTLPLLGAGLLVMNSFTGDSHFFERQIIWIALSIGLFFLLSIFDFRFLRSSKITIVLFSISCIFLLLLFVIGQVSHGALSWFRFGSFSFQPADPSKLVLIILLAKYFSKRHIEIANFKHIFISGIYAFILFALILVQPDFGSAIIIFLIWFGMILVSGISKKHLLAIFLTGALTFCLLWFFGFKEYQKVRIMNFIHPLTDIHNTGYNSYQSAIAVGSGELLGKGVGYGTQSRLKFLPEYQTDFVFAAFAEEWGFLGVTLLFILYGTILYRVISISLTGASNFEMLFGAGVAVFLIAHFFINVGMNMQLLPVTGQTLPFMSYGGTHLLTEFAGLGILNGMRRYRRTAHRDVMSDEFIGS